MPQQVVALARKLNTTLVSPTLHIPSSLGHQVIHLLPCPPSPVCWCQKSVLSGPTHQRSTHAQVSPLPYPEYGYTFSPAANTAITAATHRPSTSLPLYSTLPTTAPLKHVHFVPTPTSSGNFIHMQPLVSSTGNYHTPLSTPHVTVNPTPAVTSPSQYAPSPPPLSVALQVPTLCTATGPSPPTSQTFPHYQREGIKHVTSPAESVDFPRPYFDTSWLLKDGSGDYKFTPAASFHLPRQQAQQSTPTSLTAPDLSIVSSLTEADATAGKSARENSRSSDDNSLVNLQASAEKMSTMARSVLQELSQQNPTTTGTRTTTSVTSTSTVNSERVPLLAIGVPESLGRVPASSPHCDATSSAGAHVSTTQQPVTATKDFELVLPTPSSSLQPSSHVHLMMQQVPSGGATTTVTQEVRVGIPVSSPDSPVVCHPTVYREFQFP